MKLFAEKACFNIELREACKLIAVGTLLWMVFSAIIALILFKGSIFNIIFSLIIIILANIALYFGARLENQWLVLVGLIQAPLKLIDCVIAVFGVIFNFGGYRHMNNIFLDLLVYILIFVYFLLCGRLIISYWHQLRQKTANSVVV